MRPSTNRPSRSGCGTLRTLTGVPAMTGSLFLLVFLLGGLGSWATPVVVSWLAIGPLILTRPGESVASRVLCGFRRLSTGEAAAVETVLFGVLDRCGLDRDDIDIYVVKGRHRNAFAAGRRSIAVTRRLIEDRRAGNVDDAALAGMLCHEIGHLVTLSVRSSLTVAWLALPWRVTYRIGARLAAPFAVRQPRVLLALVVVAGLAIAVDQALRQGDWTSATVLDGLVLSTLAAPTINASASRASEYAADSYAAHAGYSQGLARALRDLPTAEAAHPRNRLLRRHPPIAHRLRNLASMVTS